MRISLGADDDSCVVDVVFDWLKGSGHEVTRYGKAAGEAEEWGRTARRVAETVAAGDADWGIVCCWTGTGVSIAANKVPGVRAALCADAETARGARRWNDANVLALSLRLTTPQVAKEILTAWQSETYAGTEAESLAVLAALDGRRRET
jgi:ribose 5-phosphate isomerase B